MGRKKGAKILGKRPQEDGDHPEGDIRGPDLGDSVRLHGHAPWLLDPNCLIGEGKVIERSGSAQPGRDTDDASTAFPMRVESRPADDQSVGLFVTVPAAPRDVLFTEYPLVFEPSSDAECEGCTFLGAAVKCPGCQARFCSDGCMARSTEAWHGAECGAGPARRAAMFCRALLALEGMKLAKPWRTGLGSFKMLLSLVQAAKRGASALHELLDFYVSLRHIRDLEVAFGESHHQQARLLWQCWEEILATVVGPHQEVLLQEVSFDTFLSFLAKYKLKNQQGALYRLQSLCVHNCRPSAAVRDAGFGGPGSPLQVLAVRALGRGDQLTTTFVNPESRRRERQEVLSRHYGIECRCSRCLQDCELPPGEMAILRADPCCLM